MQTLSMLNQTANIAHLDISENNIMLSDTATNKWDQLCLLDFGLAQTCLIGTAVNLSTILCLHRFQLLAIGCGHADSGCHFMYGMRTA